MSFSVDGPDNSSGISSTGSNNVNRSPDKDSHTDAESDLRLPVPDLNVPPKDIDQDAVLPPTELPENKATGASQPIKRLTEPPRSSILGHALTGTPPLPKRRYRALKMRADNDPDVIAERKQASNRARNRSKP